MKNYLEKSLPGAGYPEICATLDLDPESPVEDVLAAIEQLRHKAEKSRRSKKQEKKDILMIVD